MEFATKLEILNKKLQTAIKYNQWDKILKFSLYHWNPSE